MDLSVQFVQIALPSSNIFALEGIEVAPLSCIYVPFVYLKVLRG